MQFLALLRECREYFFKRNWTRGTRTRACNIVTPDDATQAEGLCHMESRGTGLQPVSANVETPGIATPGDRQQILTGRPSVETSLDGARTSARATVASSVRHEPPT